MKRSSEYFELKYIVQCKSGSRPCFETIAAFNVRVVAERYAKDCARSNFGAEYRVLTRGGKGGWIV